MDLRAVLMGLAFAAMWSSAFTAARFLVQEAPPLLTLTARFLLSGLIAIGIAAALGQRLRLDAAQWRATLVFGLCQNALYLGLFFVAMQTVEASLAAIIAASMPLMVALIGRTVLGHGLKPLAIAGLVTGFAGVATILGGRVGGTGADPLGIGLCIIGTLALAVATLTVRGAVSGGNVLMIVGVQMLVGAAALVGPALVLETPHVAVTPAMAAAFVYLTLVPGLAATWVWFRLVERIGAVRAAAFHFLNPGFGVAIAALALGEQLRALDVVGVAVVMAGILAVQLARQRPPS